MNYTQIVNVYRLHNIIEPSAALFCALGIVLAHILKQLTQPGGSASLKYGRGRLGSIWTKKSRSPTLFPSCCTYSMLAIDQLCTRTLYNVQCRLQLYIKHKIKNRRSANLYLKDRIIQTLFSGFSPYRLILIIEKGGGRQRVICERLNFLSTAVQVALTI